MKTKEDFRTGHITDIEENDIICLLKKDFHTDILLTYPKSMIRDVQKQYMIKGYYVQYDFENEKLRFAVDEKNFI